MRKSHDIRLYRIGDPINSVHWKLSAKLDELVVREPLISDKGVLAVFIDIFGTRDELEISFGKLLLRGQGSLSEGRLNSGYAFTAATVCPKA